MFRPTTPSVCLLSAAIFVAATSAAHADIRSVGVATSGFTAPVDATADRDGRTIFFLASGANGPSLFRVAAADGAVQTLFGGAPLTAPESLAIDADDDTLFVADHLAGGHGALFRFDLRRHDLDLIPSTVGYAPRGVDVRGHELFFTGTDPATHQPGVFVVDQRAGRVRVVASGAAFHDPRAIAVGHGGTTYVSDEVSPGVVDVLAIHHGAVRTLAASLSAGTPPGIALTTDEETVLVSGLDAATHTALVYMIDTETGAIGTANNGIAQNSGAGGLHRARASDVFAWCGVSGGGGGTVYRITLL